MDSKFQTNCRIVVSFRQIFKMLNIRELTMGFNVNEYCLLLVNSSEQSAEATESKHIAVLIGGQYYVKIKYKSSLSRVCYNALQYHNRKCTFEVETTEIRSLYKVKKAHDINCSAKRSIFNFAALPNSISYKITPAGEFSVENNLLEE